MTRPLITHPTWCARAYSCAGMPAGRSLPARGEQSATRPSVRLAVEANHQEVIR